MKLTIRYTLLVAGLVCGSAYGQTPPRPAILSPVNNAQLTSSQITITGTTAPNSGVTSVQFSIDGNGPFTAVQQNPDNWNSWKVPAALGAGSNQFVVWAKNSSGSSPSNTANYFLVVTSPITVNSSGAGSVTPNLNGKELVLDKNYTISALSGKGQIFAGWSGSVSSSSATLIFLMQPNMQLTASFVPNPFSANGLPGTYNGLFWESGNASESNAGLLTLTMNAGGHFAGQVLIDGGAYSFAGQFNAGGAVQVLIHRHNKADLTLMLTLDLSGVNGLSGVATSAGLNGSGAFISTLQGYRTLPITGQSGKGFSGNYSFALSGSGNADPTLAPQGFGYGKASVTPAGLAHLSFFLSDGTTAIASGHMNASGNLPLYVSLYQGAGSLQGWISFTNGAPTMNYQLFWFKNPVSKGSFTNGFAMSGITFLVDPFKVPQHGTNVLGVTNIVVQLTGGDLMATLNDPLTLSASGVGSGANPENVKVTFNNNTGIFTGTFGDPATGQIPAFRGVALEGVQDGLGYFLTPGLLSGAVVITPAP